MSRETKGVWRTHKSDVRLHACIQVCVHVFRNDMMAELVRGIVQY